MRHPRLLLACSLYALMGVAHVPPCQAGDAIPNVAERLDLYGDPLPAHALARIGTIRFHHSASVQCLAFSPDGRTLASGAPTGELRLWEVATGKLLRRFMSNTGRLFSSVAFSPDGQYLASDKGALGIWRVATGEQIQTLQRAATGSPTCLVFSSDGHTVVEGTSDDKAIWCYDRATGNPTRRIDGHGGAVTVVALSSDGHLLASASNDHTARLWEFATGKEVGRFPHREEVLDVALSPDSRLLATMTSSRIYLWDVVASAELRHIEVPHFRLRSLVFSPDGKTIAAGGILWDVATGRQRCRCEGRLSGAMAFSPDGKLLATGGYDGVIRLHDPATGKDVTGDRHGWNCGCSGVVGFGPTGEWIVVADEGGLRRCRIDTGAVLGDFPWKHGTAYANALSPDGNVVASLAMDGRLSALDVKTGQVLWSIRPGSGANRVRGQLAFSDDGRMLAACGWNQHTQLLDAHSGRVLHELRGHEGPVYEIAFAMAGRRLITVGLDNTVRVWDVAEGTEVNRPLVIKDGVYALAPDGSRLVTWHADASAHSPLIVCQAVDGRLLARCFGVTNNCCTFAPDDRMLAVGGSEVFVADRPQAVVLLEIATGKMRLRLSGHYGYLEQRAAFSRDGRRCATASWDSTVLIWDIASGLTSENER